MSKDPNIVIMAAGASSRMQESIESPDPGMKEAARMLSGLPKTMIPAGPDGRPFLDYLLLNVAKAGYSDAVIVVSASSNSIRVRYEDFADVVALPPGLRLSFAVQDIPDGRDKPAGTADALLSALKVKPDWEGKQFTVINGDNLYPVAALRAVLESEHENSTIAFDSAALGLPRAKLETFAVIKTDAGGNVLEIIEKPDPEAYDRAADDTGRINVSMNVLRFSRDMVLPILEEVPFDPVRNEKELPEAIRMMISRNPGSLYAIPLSKSVPDLTSSGDISAVIGYIRRNYPAFE